MTKELGLLSGTRRAHTTDNYATVAKKSPFLYRGYYYDSDLGFYITGTRCYDPAIGRFISPDAYDVLSIALTKSDHRVYTNAWRKEIGYKTGPHPPQVIWGAAQKIYIDRPDLLEAARVTIWGR